MQRLPKSTARMAELVDALDLGSSGAIRGGSSPPLRTTQINELHHRHRPAAESAGST